MLRRPLPRLVLALTMASAIAAPAAADIRIAVVAPLTGQFQSLGKQIRDGVEKAVADLNARGGIAGERVVVDVEDDACNAEGGAAAANRAAGRGDVLVVGHVCGEAAKAAAPVYVENGIVLISPAVTADALSDRRAGPGIFRLAPPDRKQGEDAGIFLARRFPGARIAIVDDGSPYAKPIADGAEAALIKAGQPAARRESFDGGAKDYDDLATRLVDDDIAVVFAAGEAGDVAVLLKGIRATGSPMQLVGTDTIATGEFTELAGADAEGTLFTFFTDWRTQPSASAAVAAFRAAGIEPIGFVLPAYAAVEAWAAARAAAADPAAVTGRLQNDEVQTVLGSVRFSPIGNAEIGGFRLFRWQDGAVVPAE